MLEEKRDLDGSLVSVIIPAFNEEKGISSVLESMCADPFFARTEIIVIDDGSFDATSEKVRAFPQIKLLCHRSNKGYGSAIVTGVKSASRDLIAWFDADGQHQVRDLKSIICVLLENNLDYCVGIRSKDSYQDPRRKLGKLVLKKVVEFAVGQKVDDFNSGLRVFRRDILKKYLHLLPKGFGASTTMTLLMLERNYNGNEVSIIAQERVGKSSVRQIRDGIRTLLLILRIFLIFKPLRFFGSIGLFFVFLGFAYGLWVAFSQKLGFPVLGAVVVLFGFQTIFWGLVADQISAMRRERFDS